MKLCQMNFFFLLQFKELLYSNLQNELTLTCGMNSCCLIYIYLFQFYAKSKKQGDFFLPLKLSNFAKQNCTDFKSILRKGRLFVKK